MVQLASWPAVLTHTGSVQCCAASGFAPGVPTNRDCAIDTSVAPPTHRVLTVSNGAPGCSTKLFMMRLTGFSVTRVISVQKSSPAALPSEYLVKYDDTPRRNL